MDRAAHAAVRRGDVELAMRTWAEAVERISAQIAVLQDSDGAQPPETDADATLTARKARKARKAAAAQQRAEVMRLHAALDQTLRSLAYGYMARDDQDGYVNTMVRWLEHSEAACVDQASLARHLGGVASVLLGPAADMAMQDMVKRKRAELLAGRPEASMDEVEDMLLEQKGLASREKRMEMLLRALLDRVDLRTRYSREACRATARGADAGAGVGVSRCLQLLTNSQNERTSVDFHAEMVRMLAMQEKAQEARDHAAEWLLFDRSNPYRTATGLNGLAQVEFVALDNNDRAEQLYEEAMQVVDAAAGTGAGAGKQHEQLGKRASRTKTVPKPNVTLETLRCTIIQNLATLRESIEPERVSQAWLDFMEQSTGRMDRTVEQVHLLVLEGVRLYARVFERCLSLAREATELDVSAINRVSDADRNSMADLSFVKAALAERRLRQAKQEQTRKALKSAEYTVTRCSEALAHFLPRFVRMYLAQEPGAGRGRGRSRPSRDSSLLPAYCKHLTGDMVEALLPLASSAMQVASTLSSMAATEDASKIPEHVARPYVQLAQGIGELCLRVLTHHWEHARRTRQTRLQDALANNLSTAATLFADIGMMDRALAAVEMVSPTMERQRIKEQKRLVDIDPSLSESDDDAGASALDAAAALHKSGADADGEHPEQLDGDRVLQPDSLLAIGYVLYKADEYGKAMVAFRQVETRMREAVQQMALPESGLPKGGGLEARFDENINRQRADLFSLMAACLERMKKDKEALEYARAGALCRLMDVGAKSKEARMSLSADHIRDYKQNMEDHLETQLIRDMRLAAHLEAKCGNRVAGGMFWKEVAHWLQERLAFLQLPGGGRDHMTMRNMSRIAELCMTLGALARTCVNPEDSLRVLDVVSPVVRNMMWLFNPRDALLLLNMQVQLVQKLPDAQRAPGAESAQELSVFVDTLTGIVLPRIAQEQQQPQQPQQQQQQPHLQPGPSEQ